MPPKGRPMPNAERPYDFHEVDVADAVTDTPVWHDGSEASELWSGEILCHLRARTPLLVSNYRYPVKDAKLWPHWVKATLTKDYPYRTDRPTYHPARLQPSDSGWTVDVGAWFGSPDLRGLTPANAFMLLPEGDHQHTAGQNVAVLCVEEMD